MQKIIMVYAYTSNRNAEIKLLRPPVPYTYFFLNKYLSGDYLKSSHKHKTQAVKL